MADFKSVSFAAAVHFVLRVSLFLECSNCVTHLWNFPSFLVLASICMVLVDIGVLPDRYKRNSGFHLVLEAVVSLFVMEVVMILVWSNIEVVAEIFLKSSLKNFIAEGADLMTNLIVLSFSLALFSYTTSVTNNWKIVENEYTKLKIFVQRYFKRKSSQASSNDRQGLTNDHEQQNKQSCRQFEQCVRSCLQVDTQDQESENQPQGLVALVYQPMPTMCPQVKAQVTEKPSRPATRAKKQAKQKKSC